MHDQRQLVGVAVEMLGQLGGQIGPPLQQGLRSPGRGEGDEPAASGPERGAIGVTARKRCEHTVQDGVSDHARAGGGRRAAGREPCDLAGVGEPVQISKGPAVAQQPRRIEPGGRIGGSFPGERLVEARSVREQGERSGEQVQIAFGAGGDNQVVRLPQGLRPGDGARIRGLDRGECVDPEVRARDQSEPAAADPVVTGEDRRYVEKPVQGGC